jgi:hypothetical protein
MDYGVISGFPFQMLQVGGTDLFYFDNEETYAPVLNFNIAETSVAVNTQSAFLNLAFSYLVAFAAVIGYSKLKRTKKRAGR